VWNWLRRRKVSREVEQAPELKGAPANPRTKTYSAATGYVYQYVYRGYRSLAAPQAGTAFVFSMTRDRKYEGDAVIHLLDACLAAGAGRELTSAERYAVAKMTLFAAFDELAEIDQFQTPMAPDAAAVREHLRMLDRI
jgi:hypothetical protein